MKVQESRENYLEAILVLTQRNGFVRSIDIANYMEFSKPSVSVAMANLKNALLITVDDGGGIHLTEAGQAYAQPVMDNLLAVEEDAIAAMGTEKLQAIASLMTAYNEALIHAMQKKL